MRWNALSHHAELKAGAHLYVMEALYVPGGERPAYKVGDHFRLEREGFWHANALVVEASADKIVVDDVDTNTRYELAPAVENEPHVDAPDVPFEEYTIVKSF